MAKKGSFIPRGDDPFVSWHDRLKTAATAIGATLGISADDLTEIGEDNTAIHAKVSTASTASVTAKQANKDKDDTRQEIEGRVRKFAKRVKGHRNCTEALLIQLGLVGEEDTTDMTQQQPVLVGTPLGKGQVEIAFNKMLADGVNLYSQRDGDAGFVFLARDTWSPYVDNRPLLAAGKPEMRRYMAKFVIGDAEVGYESDSITVACTP
jgi:hypothetical protein